MKRMVIALVLAGIASLSFSPAGAAPVPGIYTSTDLGGSLLLGRASQSWVAPLNANNGVSDVFNALSWNGAVLGTQWGFQCGVQPLAQGVQDNRIAGTGTVVFTNTFQGGTFFLNPGPWGSGTGTLGTTVFIVTLQYVNFNPVVSVVNSNTSGVFDNSSCALTFAISNGNGAGDTDSFAKPATYPNFLDTGCSPSRIYGSWGDVRTITMQIDCPVPGVPSTWGKVKALYR